MQKRGLFLFLFLLLLMSLPAPVSAGDRNPSLGMGIGFLVSPDYRSVLEDRYDDLFGGYGWFDFQGNIRYRLTEKLSFSAGLDLLFNYVGGDVSFLNTILVPSLSGRYSLQKVPSFFVKAEINKNWPRTGSDEFELDSGGTGYGLYGGYAVGSDLDLELGYLKLPVDLNEAEEKNFGGLMLRYNRRF